ncbi:DUF1553 domain-containing protein [Fimbriimonas ginsengisoli]|uniref:Cytochrome c domain-containing protein n=1 Tax=Fimbriimonas ginsengisoli Gsoil 348 TaxID=661478 RepID=A0A068NYF9_FIMGI|nr:DUF1553 domain-containing protein [Fimbriimonas ginsengisoli]AIE88090.1 hypothetical protein OP10G_4722 [Fimbriimonas ginsengisoli Gsoil 348]
MKASLPALLLSLGVVGYAVTPVQTPAAAERVSFSRDVKPILSQRCFKCHGPDVTKAAAGLRLDSFAGATKLLAGGHAAIVPRKPDASWLLKRVGAPDKEMRMPPPDAGVPSLTPAQVDILRRWIAQGAKYELHWSFVPPKLPAAPSVSDPKWCRNLIDRFVMAKLDKAGLKPEPEADRETLAMRASLTLTGLQPTPAALERFLKDKGTGAYERYVDRLLASPTYGEHQARYWLDAVRYGDTHGLHLDNERGIYPYRDWVVRAFNKDLPFDKFTEWQLAGDLLPKPTTEQLVATGYVRMNPTSDEGGAIEEEFLARNTFDRVDTTSTVFLGLSVACARCHDHKYDPIKQRDYYGLYAFFNSTEDKPLDDNALLPPPVVRAATEEEESHLAALDRELAALTAKVDASVAEDWLTKSHVPNPATRDWQVSPVYMAANFEEAYAKAQPGEPGQAEPAWKPVKLEVGKPLANIIAKENASIYVRGTISVEKARTITLGVSSDDGIKIWLNGNLIHDNKALRGLTTATDAVKADLKAGDNVLVAKVVNAGGEDGINIRMGDPGAERMDKALADFHKSPTPAAADELRRIYLENGPASVGAIRFRTVRKERDDFEAGIPMTMIAKEMMKPRPAFILRRGEYNLKGDPVVRHIPPSLGALPTAAKADRLSLAKWFISPSNPLVARVFVNRVWQQHFGTGIVKTAEDFGSQGEWPVNPELLDYLAVTFVQNGWSVKQLNRMIVTSASFRQSSRISKAKHEADPENRLISRGPRYRLDAEVIRDKALAAGGLLLHQVGGKGFKPYQPDGLWEAIAFDSSTTAKYMRDRGDTIYRRSLYLFWKRTSPHPVMLTFDAPMRDSCVVRRSRTNTPLQALTTLNEPAFLEASRTMAEILLRAPGDDESRLRKGYEIALGRAPKPAEISLIKGALERYRQRYAADPAGAEHLLKVGDAPRSQAIPASEHAAWMLICSTLMNTDEFLCMH